MLRAKTGTCAAPEVLTELTYCGKRADVWSCGVMLYAMLFESYPFQRLGDRTNGDGGGCYREVKYHMMISLLLNQILPSPGTPSVQP